MSTSDKRGQGESNYLDRWNPSAKRHIIACQACGHRGYDPEIESFASSRSSVERVVLAELQRLYAPIELDALGLCRECRSNTE